MQAQHTSGIFLFCSCWISFIESFVVVVSPPQNSLAPPTLIYSISRSTKNEYNDVVVENKEEIKEQESITTSSSKDLSEVAKKFKILTCMSTSCAKKRQSLNMDSFATYGAMYSRIQDNAPTVQLEESPCLGSCKEAPCIAVEHDDYIGTVGLVGMTDPELSQRVFHRIITEEDADRVWSCVENGIDMMAKEENCDDEEKEEEEEEEEEEEVDNDHVSNYV